MGCSPKISVIVPIYNAGQYMKKCLDTIVNQTLKELEIILVLDCPTDGSDKIAEEYALRDNRIKLIFNEENLHIGLSRNKGLEVATGEYIAFSDHDDYREPDMYETLYEQVKREGTDVILSQSALVVQDEIEVWELPDIDVKYNREYCLLDLLGGGNYENVISHFCYIHNGLYKRELLLANNIKFVDTREITPEDVIFQIKSVFHAGKVSFCRKVYYYHILHSVSEGHSYEYGSWQRRVKGLNEIYQFLMQKKCYKTYEVVFLLQVRRQLLGALLGVLLHEKDIRVFFSALRQVKIYPFTQRAFRFYSRNECITLKNPIKKLFRTLITLVLAR